MVQLVDARVSFLASYSSMCSMLDGAWLLLYSFVALDCDLTLCPKKVLAS